MTTLLNSPVVVSFITGTLAIIGIAVAEVLRRQHKAIGAVKANSDIVREQTQNSHTTNLRDDIDRVLHGISVLSEQVATLGVDAAWERRERMDVSKRLDHHISICTAA